MRWAERVVIALSMTTTCLVACSRPGDSRRLLEIERARHGNTWQKNKPRVCSGMLPGAETAVRHVRASGTKARRHLCGASPRALPSYQLLSGERQRLHHEVAHVAEDRIHMRNKAPYIA